VEFNPPQQLLHKSHSKFRAMYDAMKASPRGDSINEDDEPIQPDALIVGIADDVFSSSAPPATSHHFS
jgi:hypothetical protein